MKIPLISAYKGLGDSADKQRCINLRPVPNPADAPFPVTHFPTPGLVKRGLAPTVGFRCLYRSTDNQLFAVVGSGVYSIATDWTFKLLGAISTIAGPVCMLDNSLDMLIVDGSGTGYVVELGVNSFATVSNDAFYGSVRIGIIDGFFILHRPSTNQFYISGELATTFDPLDIVAKSGGPDKIVTIANLNRLLWLFGESTTEVWTNTGAADFTFERIPGVFVQHGCAAANSVARMDTSIYLLAQDQEGKCFVARTEGQSLLRISTQWLDREIQGYATINDAVGYTYQIDGCFCYVLTFPSINKTWVFDRSNGEWHQWGWFDATTGNFNRHRSSCYVVWNGKSLVGDYATADLYELSSASTDDFGGPIRHLRTTAHLTNEGAMTIHQQVRIAMRVGDGLPGTFDKPQVWLRWSNDGGRSWGNPVMRDFGGVGETLRNIEFNGLGVARVRVYEVSYSASVPCEISGLYLKAVGGRA